MGDMYEKLRAKFAMMKNEIYTSSVGRERDEMEAEMRKYSRQDRTPL